MISATRYACLCTIVLIVSSLVCEAQLSSTFDTDLEGWTITGDNIAAWEADTGNPDGCLLINDLVSGDRNYLVAPPQFLGDWSGAGITDTISFDVYLHNSSGGGVSVPDYMIEISGPGGSARAIDALANYPPNGVWTTYQVSLDEALWMVDEGTWPEIMASVRAVVLNGEFVIGDEVVRIDNVSLSHSPVFQLVPCESDDFSTAGTADWSFTGTQSVSNPGSGGNGGGYVQIADDAEYNSYAFAPGRFHLDWTTLDGSGMVTIDLRVISSSGTNLGAPEFIRITGPGGSAYVSLDPGDLPVSSRVWKTFQFPIDSSTWTVDTGSWAALLAEITECRIDMEFFDGTESVGFDNFGRLAAGCPAVDDPLQLADPTVSNCGYQSLLGVSGVALNPIDGLTYGMIRSSSSSGGGVYPLEGPNHGTRLQACETPAHLIFDSDGDLYTSEDYSGYIFRLEWGGSSSTWVNGFHSGDDDPVGMIFAPPGFNGTNVSEGDILVTDRGSAGADQIWAFSPDTAQGERLVMPDPGETDHVDLAASQSGTVYVCDALDPNNLYLLSPEGGLSTLALDSPVSSMMSLVYDEGDAVLYVAGSTDDTVHRVDPSTGVVTLVASGFSALGWGCLEVDSVNRTLWVADSGYNRVYQLCLSGLPGWTVEADLSCLPSSGTVPFSTQMTATLINHYTGQIRRMAARIDISLAGGQTIGNWRAGYTNVAAGSSFTSSWVQGIPALGSVIGENLFQLSAEDVTPAPYNQPPYPPAGDTATSACTVTGIAP